MQCTVYFFFVCRVYNNAGNGILVLVDILLFNKGVNTKCFVLFERVSDCCFNANSAIFQLYHGENKLIFNEMVRSALY